MEQTVETCSSEGFNLHGRQTHTCMGVHVVAQQRKRTESFKTDVALMWLFVGMFLHMAFKVRQTECGKETQIAVLLNAS